MTVAAEPMKSPLTRFVVAALAWLPVTFALWYLCAALLLWPVQLAATLLARGAFGDLVQAVEASGPTLTFVTTLRPGSGQAQGLISVDVNMLLYAFGLPLFAALTLAARDTGWWRTLAMGYGAILPFVVWGVLADFLKNVAITASPLVASQAGFSSWQREVIAFAYQFGSLILPAVVPVVVWVLTHRVFLERLRRPVTPRS
jgi:hypothetical protein